MDDHPNHLVALSYAHHDGFYAYASSQIPIFSIGAFIVERINDEEARFTVSHVVFGIGASRDLLLAHVGSLLRDDSYAIGCEPPDRKGQPGAQRLLESALAGTAKLPRGRRRLMRATDASLAAIARDFDLPFTDGNVTQFQRARAAAFRAQAIWLASLEFYHDENTKRSLFSAYIAWRALQNARPIMF